MKLLEFMIFASIVPLFKTEFLRIAAVLSRTQGLHSNIVFDIIISEIIHTPLKIFYLNLKIRLRLMLFRPSHLNYFIYKLKNPNTSLLQPLKNLNNLNLSLLFIIQFFAPK